MTSELQKVVSGEPEEVPPDKDKTEIDSASRKGTNSSVEKTVDGVVLNDFAPVDELLPL